VLTADIASADVILDRCRAGELHPRTVFPSGEASESDREWMPAMVKIVAANDHGKWLTRASVNWR
jgi:hypothetical protein